MKCLNGEKVSKQAVKTVMAHGRQRNLVTITYSQYSRAASITGSKLKFNWVCKLHM